MEKKPASLCAVLERAITSSFYNGGEGRLRAISMGLQVPLWLWTYQVTMESERESREMQKAVNLVRWFHDNGANLAHVAIIAPLEMRQKLRMQLLSSLCGEQENGAVETGLPTILAPHDLTAMNARDKTVHQYDVVLYILGLSPTNGTIVVGTQQQQEQFLSDAIAGARGAFVLIANAGWTSPELTSGWPQWRTFVMKLQEENPLISSEATQALPNDARLPSLVGPRIPLCCPRHPGQRQLEHGMTPVSRICKRLCLRPFACQEDGHVCMDLCHPRVSHLCCPYVCSLNMPCGHDCLQSCSERCNCFEVNEHPLQCSHVAVIGLDQTNMQPLYATVRHVFRGYCADAELPCAVEYVTECARCLGPLTVNCTEATQQKHTLDHRTILCPNCIRLEREVRAKILGEILVQTEEAKRRMKLEVQRSLHQQRKASSQGLFQEGSRVTICDISKVVKPLCADADFPGVKFIDYDSSDFFSTIDGAYGTFVSRHVDIDDLSEVRNLIRLRDGQHVLVADGGVRLIRALTTSITQQAPVLLLTNGDNGKGATSLSDAEELARVLRMLGKDFYLAVPVPYDGESISDKIVRVLGPDSDVPGNVVVECRVAVVAPHMEDPVVTGCDNQGADESMLKRPRVESERRAIRRASVEILRLSAPVAALEPMEGYAPGKEVLVLEPERQVTNPHDVQAFEAALAAMPEMDLRGAALSTAQVARDTPFVLLGIVNPPANLEERYGPCAVLRRRVRLAALRAAPARPRGGRGAGGSRGGGRGGRGGGGSRGGGRGGHWAPAAPGHSAPSLAAGPAAAEDSTVVLVPFVFTAADELLEAENSLDAAALEKFEQRVCEVIEERSEELAIRHDEEAFHQQRQMAEVTAEELARDRVAFSCPIPLPTPEFLAAVRTRHARLSCASDLSLRVCRQKDTLTAKQEQLGLSKWLEALRLRHEQDREANVAYIKGLERKTQVVRR